MKPPRCLRFIQRNRSLALNSAQAPQCVELYAIGGVRFILCKWALALNSTQDWIYIEFSVQPDQSSVCCVTEPHQPNQKRLAMLVQWCLWQMENTIGQLSKICYPSE